MRVRVPPSAFPEGKYLSLHKPIMRTMKRALKRRLRLRNTLFVCISLGISLALPPSGKAQSVQILRNGSRTQAPISSAQIPGAFVIQAHESLAMYAAWTQIPPAEILIQSGFRNPQDFLPGKILRLLLSPEQWLRVHLGRTKPKEANGGFEAPKPLQALQALKPLETPPPLKTSALPLSTSADWNFFVHTVQRTENGASIAEYYNLRIEVLEQANGGKKIHKVTPGQKIYIPNLEGRPRPPHARLLQLPTPQYRPSKTRK